MICGWIFSALIAIALALCPDVKTKPDFDLTKYVGDWYEIQRTDDAFQSDAKCVRARYAALDEPGTFSVLNSGVTGNGTYLSIAGVGTQPNASAPASLTVVLPGLPLGSYLILDTDYTTFATVYSCDETSEGKIEQGRLYSRNKTLPQDQIDLVMKDFADLGVNISQFQNYYQGEDCQYDAPLALCPDVKTKIDFDLSKYVGDWYEIQRIDAAFQFDAQCVRARYAALEEPGTFSVLNTGIMGDGTYLSITGVGTQTNESAPASLTVQFPRLPPGSYLVLDTDYTTFATVYSCEVAFERKIEQGWLLSRTKTLPQDQIARVMNDFTKLDVNITRFKKYYQGDNCQYDAENSASVSSVPYVFSFTLASTIVKRLF